MNIIVMTKKGIGTVTFTQYEDGGLIHIIDVVGIESNCTVEEVDGKYRQYYGKGFRRNSKLEEKAQKAYAPKSPKKSTTVKKTREESLTEKYGTKEERKAYIEAKKAFRRFYLSKGMKYGKDFDATVKYALDQWEANGRPDYNC